MVIEIVRLEAGGWRLEAEERRGGSNKGVDEGRGRCETRK